MANLTPDSISQLTQLWVDGEVPTEADLRAAKSIAAQMAEFVGLKPFSTVVQRLVDYVATPNFKLERVRELIESDPALAARIMRVANSAAYGAYGACASIAKAVLRIGTTGVVDLAMGMSAMAMFEDLGGIGSKVRDHSAGTAAVARELACRLDPSAPSSLVFLAGLLHDIGKLLMIQSGDPQYAELITKEPLRNSWHLKERVLFGFDHGQLGGHVLRVWNLPQPIPEIIASLHLPKMKQGGMAATSRAVDILRVADEIEWLLDQDIGAESAQVAHLVNSPDGVRAGLTVDSLSELWDGLAVVRQEAVSLFR